MRAVIDTNTLLRLATGGQRSLLFRHWRARRFELLMSLATLTELRTVLARPDVQRYVPEPLGTAFAALVEQRAILVQPDLSAPTCRDPQDSALIATAVGGRADYLVTTDPDLLDDPGLIEALAGRGVRLLRPPVFLTQLAS